MQGGIKAELVLGKRLQSARQAAGLTQQRLCQLANLSYSTLAKIERGAIKSPSIFTIQAIAGALSISLDELIGQTLEFPSRRATKRSKTKSGVSFIFFDVNGCLVRFYQQAFNRIAADFDVPADIVETTFWRYNDDVCRGSMSMSDFNRTLADRLGIGSIDWPAYYLAAAKPVEEMHDLALWVSQHYGIGLLTNTMPGLVGAMLKSGQLPNLPYDAVIDSSEVGAIKPETHIFELASNLAGVSPGEILLIDDTRANLNAADQLGWHVMWFDYALPAESVTYIKEALEPTN